MKPDIITPFPLLTQHKSFRYVLVCSKVLLSTPNDRSLFCFLTCFIISVWIIVSLGHWPNYPFTKYASTFSTFQLLYIDLHSFMASQFALHSCKVCFESCNVGVFPARFQLFDFFSSVYPVYFSYSVKPTLISYTPHSTFYIYVVLELPT